MLDAIIATITTMIATTILTIIFIFIKTAGWMMKSCLSTLQTQFESWLCHFVARWLWITGNFFDLDSVKWAIHKAVWKVYNMVLFIQ